MSGRIPSVLDEAARGRPHGALRGGNGRDTLPAAPAAPRRVPVERRRRRHPVRARANARIPIRRRLPGVRDAPRAQRRPRRRARLRLRRAGLGHAVIGPPVQIGDRLVGPGRPCFVVAEAGVNHDGDLAAAKQLVRAAAEARADCVKFQLFKAEEVASAAAPKAAYQLETTDPGESQLAMLKRLELAEDALPELVDEARRAGLEFLCSCYSEQELDLLDDLGVPAFKFASAQL